MSPQPVQCTNCGAGMPSSTDGRRYQCRYCGSQVLVAVDADQLAAGMKLDLSNVEAFLKHLAETLETTFASQTRIVRNGAQVTSVQIDLGADLFVAKREGHGVVGQHKKVVRGIALKTATHPLDRWAALLHQALAAHVSENARATEALTSLFGKPQ